MKPALVSIAALSCLSAALVATTPAHAAAGHRSPAGLARSQAAAHAGVGAGQGLIVRDTIRDAAGTHVRFDRTYHGLPVVGGDLVVHQSTTGAFRSISGRNSLRLSLGTTPAITGPAAARVAGATVHWRGVEALPRLVVLAVGQKARLTWRVSVEGRRTDGSPAGRFVFVSARTGRVVAHWASEVNAAGTGNGLTVGTVPLDTTQQGSGYVLIDPARGNGETHNGPATGAPLFTDADNVWGNGSNNDPATAGVDAAYGVAKTWDFYKSTFGRNGIANDGKGARSFVHDGLYANASWSDACFCMRYGDGDGAGYLPLVAIDVAGHEMSHGVTSRTAGLTYRGESGGLNEATSDIFGTMVEWYANNSEDVPDYVIGEEVYRSYNPATNFIRRMDKPSLDGGSLDCYSKRAKSVDVHYSSGIANHFFYLLSEGSGAKTINGIAYNSPTCNGSTLTGIGRDKAAAIWYKALTTYMTSNTTFAGARTATTSAATTLYGAASPEVAAVQATWSAVGVG